MKQFYFITALALPLAYAQETGYSCDWNIGWSANNNCWGVSMEQGCQSCVNTGYGASSITVEYAEGLAYDECLQINYYSEEGCYNGYINSYQIWGAECIYDLPGVQSFVVFPC
jgi:hypothetical protein